MEAAGCSSFFKVGPNDAKPNHEPGRGQMENPEKSAQPIVITKDC